MSNERAKKDKAMASYMKERGIKRTTSQCVWGCGHAVSIGGPALLAHLGVCQGSPRKRR